MPPPTLNSEEPVNAFKHLGFRRGERRLVHLPLSIHATARTTRRSVNIRRVPDAREHARSRRGRCVWRRALGDEAGARLDGLVPLGAQSSMWWSVARSAFTGIVRARPTPRISMMPRMPQYV